MERRALLAILPLAVACAGHAAEAEPFPASLAPPPGWTDVTAQTPVRGVVLALRGPQASSFALARMPVSALEGAAATRAYLLHVLDALRAGARLDYRSNGRVETATLRNGVTARFLRATLDGRPRLLVAAVDDGGPPLLATLSSAAPDAMMGPLLGALRLGAPGAVRTAGTAQSSDGQLRIALGGGLRSRELTGDEHRQGAVLAIQGAGSEVVFSKVEGEDASPRSQAALARTATAAAAQVALDGVSAARRAPTPAGPEGVYAWARIAGTPDLRFAAGFLPWQYWGYSLLARGPQADEILVGALAALKQGPSAVARLVSATPQIAIAGDRSRRRRWAGAAVAMALLLFVWRRRKKRPA